MCMCEQVSMRTCVSVCTIMRVYVCVRKCVCKRILALGLYVFIVCALHYRPCMIEYN